MAVIRTTVERTVAGFGNLQTLACAASQRPAFKCKGLAGLGLLRQAWGCPELQVDVEGTRRAAAGAQDGHLRPCIVISTAKCPAASPMCRCAAGLLANAAAVQTIPGLPGQQGATTRSPSIEGGSYRRLSAAASVPPPPPPQCRRQEHSCTDSSPPHITVRESLTVLSYVNWNNFVNAGGKHTMRGPAPAGGRVATLTPPGSARKRPIPPPGTLPLPPQGLRP